MDMSGLCDVYSMERSGLGATVHEPLGHQDVKTMQISRMCSTRAGAAF